MGENRVDVAVGCKLEEAREQTYLTQPRPCYHNNNNDKSKLNLLTEDLWRLIFGLILKTSPRWTIIILHFADSGVATQINCLRFQKLMSGSQ